MGDTSNLVFGWRTTMMLMVCLPIVIASVLLVLKKYETIPSRYLAGFFLLAVIAVGPQIIGFAGFYDVWPGLTFFPFATDLWIGPLFYLHAYRLIKGAGPKWQRLLLIPGILQTSYYTWAFLALGDYKQKWAFTESFHLPYITPVESGVAILLLLFALISVWKMNREYKEYLQQTESVASEFEPVWIDRMVLAMLIGGTIYAVLEVVVLLTDISYRAAFPFQVLLMATFAWLSVESVWRLSQPFPKLGLVPLVTDADARQTEKDWTTEASLIRTEVVNNSWYLEPRFSLRELSKRIASNEAYVSRAINRGMGLTYNDFINRLRVEHSQTLIAESDKQLLMIALESGFNSKATFNRVFRDITDMTPSQFKKNNLSKGLKT